MILKNGKKEIVVREWPCESPKAIVLIFHGMAEHAARYDAFARYLSGNGYYVVADDHRGHGKTDEKSLGYAKKDMFENTLSDEALILETFQKKYDHHQPGRGFRGTVSKRNLYVLQNSAPPAVFVELANIQNTYDQQRIVESNNRQALANWIAEAFVKDYKSNK